MCKLKIELKIWKIGMELFVEIVIDILARL